MDKPLITTEESAGAVIQRCSVNKVFEKLRQIKAKSTGNIYFNR